MHILKAEEVKIREIIEFLQNDGIIIYPTETLYGIGVKFDNKKLLKKIFELKRRPLEKVFPLIVNLKNINMVISYLPPLAERLIKLYWPGPLTLLLPAKLDLSKEIVFNNKVAVRMPGESFALDLIQASPFPITATSANISGMPPASDFAKVIEYFRDSKDNILLIDGGKLKGVPSTILDVTTIPPKVIRQGVLEVNLSFD